MVSLLCNTNSARFNPASLYPFPSTNSLLSVAKLVLQPIGNLLLSSSSNFVTSSLSSLLPWFWPWFTASMVLAKKSRIASSTCSVVAIGDRESFASDSVMRTMASSWRTVMGMELRALRSTSFWWTCLRICTKCEDSFSAASGLRRGAQRLIMAC